MVAPSDDDVIRAHALRHAHGGSPALTGVSLGVREGEVLAVCGPRGSGKTTLLHCLCGQLAPDEGEVHFRGAPVHGLTALQRERLRRENFGWVGPEPALLPELTVWENAALPLLLRGETHRRARAAATEWLERLDVDSCAQLRPHALTLAQRQRTATARALVAGPAVLFADEPTAMLHRVDRALVLRTLLAAARSNGIAVVLATHDPQVAALADRAIPLVDGRPSDAPGDAVPLSPTGAGTDPGARAGDGTDAGAGDGAGDDTNRAASAEGRPGSGTDPATGTASGTGTDAGAEGQAECSLSV